MNRWVVGLVCLVTPCYVVGRTPNVIVFLADDMGIGDVGCYGCRDIQTPNLDALARSGARLTNFYVASPICAPSRAALITGRYPNRIGMSTDRNIESGMDKPGIPSSEITLAELVRSQGYATAALGKWHLGSTHETQPNAQGFDLFFGHHASCIDAFSHMYYASLPYYHDLYRNRQEVFEDGKHMTDLITREATRFIEENKNRPFLIYAAYNAPHYPMVAHERFHRQYAHLPQARRDYAAMVAGLDESVGAIMAKLAEAGLAEDTFVFFTSDNGAADPSPRGEGGGSNAPYREYKRSLFDGGIHMPAIISWPRRVPAGQVRDQLAIAMDLFSTVAEITGSRLPPDHVIDGRSWMPFLLDPSKPGHDILFFEWDGQQAVRQGKWKVVRNGLMNMAQGRTTRATGNDAVFLADLSADPGEKVNVCQEHPDVAQQLLSLHAQWQSMKAK
ncbi:MAG: sulfatase-like hydrolase/transferase [Phycisphaerae bacterium]